MTTGCHSVSQFSAALDAYPAGFAGNVLNLLLVEDAHSISSPRDYLQHLAGPTLSEVRREYVVGGHVSWPFPIFHVHDRPDPWLLSERLFAHFDEAGQVMLKQRDLCKVIELEVRRAQPDVVALVIVDGLSYYDLPQEVEAEPCLVEGVSITDVGYQHVVGRPEISRRLFALGYANQIGYTYFTPETGSVAEKILAAFSESQIVKARTFDEILAHLSSEELAGSYVQIAMPGLDEIAHAHHDAPPREHYLGEILRRYSRLVDLLSARGRRVLACLTADHGILWREAIEGKLEVVGDLLPEDTGHARYVRGHFLRTYARCVTCLDSHYTVFRFPFMTRGLRNNEWGVHGGISAWESIVPFMTRAI